MHEADQNAFFQRLSESDGYLIILADGKNLSIETDMKPKHKKLSPYAKTLFYSILSFINDYRVIHNVLHNIKKSTKNQEEVVK